MNCHQKYNRDAKGIQLSTLQIQDTLSLGLVYPCRSDNLILQHNELGGSSPRRSSHMRQHHKCVF